MINSAMDYHIPSRSDRPHRARPDSTQTFVRLAQQWSNRGYDPAGSRDVPAGEPAPRGLFALLRRLWPFASRA